MLGNKLSDIKTISSAKKAQKTKNSSSDLPIEVPYPSSNSMLSVNCNRLSEQLLIKRKLENIQVQKPKSVMTHYGLWTLI